LREIYGDIWDFFDQGHYITITINGTIKKNGSAVMGRGIAKQAALRFPQLPYELGRLIRDNGLCVCPSPSHNFIYYPVKFNFWEIADLQLISRSCVQLVELTDALGLDVVYMVRPGCGNGKLDWNRVKSMLEDCLDNRFVIVERSVDVQEPRMGITHFLPPLPALA
jgi:hypothetical protein